VCVIGLYIYTYVSVLNFACTCTVYLNTCVYAFSLFVYLSWILKYSVCLAKYEETDVYERIPYHGRNWSFLRPIICPQFYTENRRFLTALENNYSRNACSLNGKILLCLGITSLSCIDGVKAKLHPFLNPT
jgi:hypothetical protein